MDVPPKSRKVANFEYINIGELLGAQPSDLPQNPTEEEELASFFTPEQWPYRPPTTLCPMLPIKRTQKAAYTLPDTAVLVFKDGKYLFVADNFFSMQPSMLHIAPEVDPASLFEQGWRGD